MQKSEKTVVADENFALRTKQRRTEEQGEIQRALPLARVQLFNEKFFEQISKQILSRIE